MYSASCFPSRSLERLDLFVLVIDVSQQPAQCLVHWMCLLAEGVNHKRRPVLLEHSLEYRIIVPKAKIFFTQHPFFFFLKIFSFRCTSQLFTKATVIICRKRATGEGDEQLKGRCRLPVRGGVSGTRGQDETDLQRSACMVRSSDTRNPGVLHVSRAQQKVARWSSHR